MKFYVRDLRELNIENELIKFAVYETKAVGLHSAVSFCRYRRVASRLCKLLNDADEVAERRRAWDGKIFPWLQEMVG